MSTANRDRAQVAVFLIVKMSGAEKPLLKRLLHVRRISRTTSGGKKRSVWALMIVGDADGSAGFGTGRAIDPQNAVLKATQDAINNMEYIKRYDNRTVFSGILLL